jgi:hypothetical protein
MEHLQEWEQPTRQAKHTVMTLKPVVSFYYRSMLVSTNHGNTRVFLNLSFLISQRWSFDLLESQVNRSVLEEYDEDDARTNGVRTHAAAAARLKAKIPFEERIDIVPNNRSLFVVN